MRMPFPANPEDMNDDRSESAAEALSAFQRVTGPKDEDALGDLLCDLMHRCDRDCCEFDASLSRARMHYKAETMSVPGEADDAF